MSEPIDWKDISDRLRAPFNPAEVDFRVQGSAGQSGKAQAVAYIDARTVQDRLDEVVGAGAWSFDWTPLVTEKGDVQVAKGTLTIHGVSKSDAGTASNFEQSLGAVSHCFKRAAVMWGIGRYLYELPAAWVTVEGKGRIADATLAQLRAKLPRPDGSQPQQPQQPAKPAPAKSQPAQRPQAQAPHGWTTADGYDPTGDLALKQRAKAIGITNMADYESFLRDVRDHYRIYDRAAIDAEMRTREGRHEQAQAKVAQGKGA